MYIITLFQKPEMFSLKILNIIFNTYFKANDTLTDDMDGFMTVNSRREEEPFKINDVVYSIIGLAATSVLFIILYLCTHILEKCLAQKNFFLT